MRGGQEELAFLLEGAGRVGREKSWEIQSRTEAAGRE